MALVGLAVAFVSGAEAAPCPPGTVSVSLTTPSDLQGLRDLMDCSGQGVYDVTLHSSFNIAQTIEVVNGKTVTLTGSGNPTISGGLTDTNEPGAVVGEGFASSLFKVSNGSSLTLKSLVLDGGDAVNGGAVALHDSSALHVFGCGFTNNKASFGGAIYANQSQVHIDGDSYFSENLASQTGGAVHCGSSSIHIRGSTRFNNNSAGSADCAVCSDQYSPGIAHRCRKCSEDAVKSAVGLVFTVVLSILLVTGGVLRQLGTVADEGAQRRKDAIRSSHETKCFRFQDKVLKALPITAVKIVVVVWQIVSQFSAIAGDVYPKEYEIFLSYLSFATFDIGFMMSYSCLFSHNFYSRLLLATITPIGVLVVLAGACYVAKKRYKTCAYKMAMVQSKHLAAVLFFTFFVYSSVSYTIFQTFICDALDDGDVYLQADYSLKCSTEQHDAYTIYAALMVVVYPVGIPVFFLWWLLRNSRYLKMSGRHSVAHLQPFSNIWGTYRPSRYYYEVVECCRRITLTMASAFLIPNTVNQIAVVLSLAAVFLFISEWMSPFARGADMSLYRWGNGVVLASMYVALLIKTNDSNQRSGVVSVFGSVLIIANVVMVVALLVQTVLLAKDAWRGTKTGFVPSSLLLHIPDPSNEEEMMGAQYGESIKRGSSDRTVVVFPDPDTHSL